MKNIFTHHLEQAARRETLTEEERARMRFMLSEYADLLPIRGSLAQPKNSDAPWIRYAGAFVVLVLIVSSSGGLVFASESALPGSLLYGLKTAVVEPLSISLARGGSAKASLLRQFAERRLDEAAALAQQGKLSYAIEAKLAENFAMRADHADALVAMTDAETAHVSDTAFHSELAAYEVVLAKVASTSTATSTDKLRSLIYARITQKSSPPMQGATLSMAEIAPQDASESTAVEQLAHRTDKVVRTSFKSVLSASSTLASTSAREAKKELSKAKAHLSEGRERLRNNDTEGARKAFDAAVETSSRAKVLSRASASLHVNFFDADDASASATSSGSENSENKKGKDRDD